ncbi:MAG: hypothetical protein IT449_13995 [Phycisphaerales bacterium]|nr:hypothetical protein [Phycisphaerales bacterium]
MKRPLLLILLGVLGVMALYAVTKKPAAPGEVRDEDEPIPTLDPAIASVKAPLHERDLPGEEPKVPPIFHCIIDPDKPPGKALNLIISEEHEYYAESLSVRLWKKSTPEKSLSLFFDKYLAANDPLELRVVLVDEDIGYVADGSLGEAEDWDSEIRCRRAREKNPVPLPSLSPG